jgi:hypothetical protein
VILELPPEQFQFGNYDADLIPTGVYMADDGVLAQWILDHYRVIGYQEHPSFRDQTGSFAVMLEDDEEHVGWSHLHKSAFSIMQDKEAENG